MKPDPDSEANVWRTPPALFKRLHAIFRFTVDACADEGNALLPRYWDDCESEEWEGERVFCNPPFARKDKILPRAKRATVAVFIMPVDCLTTAYFKRSLPVLLVFPAQRIVYHLADGTPQAGADFGSFLAIYGKVSAKQVKFLGAIGTVWKLA